jgi:hypothetical protein
MSSIVVHTAGGDVALKAGDRIVVKAGTSHLATVGHDGARWAEAYAVA